MKTLFSVHINTQSLVDTSEFPRYRLCDVWLNALTLTDIVGILRHNIDLRHKFILANQNLHSLYLCTQNAKVREFFATADYTHIDGTSLIFLGKLAGLPFRNEHRNGYMDLFPALLPTVVQNGWRIFYLGCKEEVLATGLAKIRESHPGVAIAGHHGYFGKGQDTQKNDEILELIRHFKPHILFVGMGMPLQEEWILANFPRLESIAVLHCGGLMDYIAGNVATPPRWLGPIGLEWTFRLFSEPRRLWRRYLLEPFQLFSAVILRKSRKRQ
jgi:N-acetylglucosaminyldiphosphoundecaprenol N-acetyl-beta-D-mannosaminyltransferase